MAFTLTEWIQTTVEDPLEPSSPPDYRASALRVLLTVCMWPRPGTQEHWMGSGYILFYAMYPRK